MNKRVVAIFVISISSLSIWELLTSKNIIGGKTQSILVLLSLVPFVYYSYKLLNDYKFESSYFKFIFSLFFCYELIIVIRGWSFSYNDLKNFMQSGYVFWPFIIPLFIFFNKNITTFGLFFKWIYYSGLFFLVITLIFPSLLFHRLTAETLISLVVPCGFLILNATYLSNRKVNISFIIIFISILFLTYLARRSSLVTLLGFVISGYFLNLMNKSKSKLFRYFPLIIIISAFLLSSQYFNNYREVLFNKITLRFSEDTRTDVFGMFFYDLKDNMLFGKGMNGTYYCPFVSDIEVDGVNFEAVEYRNIIENGYLQLLLTGGVVHIIIFLLVLLPAAILGIFKSSNQFSMACGVLILLWLLDMVIYGLPRLSLHYIVVWICVGICFKSSIRRMTNDEILKEFQKAKLI